LTVRTETPAELAALQAAEEAARAAGTPLKRPPPPRRAEPPRAGADGAGAGKPPAAFDRSLVAAQVREFVAAYVDTHPSSRLSRVRYLSFEALSFDGERPRRPGSSRGGDADADDGGGDDDDGPVGR
jgi:hypothetical protein